MACHAMRSICLAPIRFSTRFSFSFLFCFPSERYTRNLHRNKAPVARRHDFCCIIGSSLISDTKSSIQRFVVMPRNCFNINLRYLWIAISLCISAYVNVPPILFDFLFISTSFIPILFLFFIHFFKYNRKHGKMFLLNSF